MEIKWVTGLPRKDRKITLQYKFSEFLLGALDMLTISEFNFCWVALNSCNYCFINPFIPNASFLYPREILENLTVFQYFQGVEKGWIGNEWVKQIISM